MTSPTSEGGRPDLTILMPVYNEAATVAEAIRTMLAERLPVESLELIVINDGSADGSGEILDAGPWPDTVRVVHHERNQGKGAAIRTGLEVARGRITTIMDADLELSPADLARLLPPILEGRADVVFGARSFPRHTARQVRYLVGNVGVSFAASVLYQRRIHDIMTCYKAMETELFRSLELKESGFGIEAEITARLLQSRSRLVEVPVSYEPRTRKEGKKLTMFDGVRVLRTLARCRFRRRPTSTR
ncbi:MAG: glycosyltransferase family 2 protein [Actinomycetes bacterium]